MSVSSCSHSDYDVYLDSCSDCGLSGLVKLIESVNGSKTDTVAAAIKEQWDVQVAITGVGEKSLAIHEAALRIAYALQAVDEDFYVEKFLTQCGVEDLSTVTEG